MVYQKKNLPVPFKDSHLEIHWKITERFLSVSFEMDQLWDRAHLVFLHNREIKTFSPEDMVIVLCVHGTKHFWQNLKWLADLIHLISQYPDLDWHIIWERAEKMGVRRIVSLGLDLAQEQGGIKYPGDFKHLLSSGNDFKKCVNNVQTNFFHFQSSKWFSISPAFYLKLREKFKDKVNFFIYTFTDRILPPNSLDFNVISLPDSFYPVYVVIRPFRLLKDYYHERVRSPHSEV